jgi:hypothetical protein
MLARLLTFCSIAAAAGVIASSAAADGLPVLNVDASRQGVAVRGGAVRYVTLPAGRDTTLVQTAVAGGQILGVTRLRGTFTIPAVAYDGSSSGLSADGTTLVLITPRPTFPRARTTFAVLDALPMLVRRVAVLRGDFSFDAISPDGSTMFLIQYVSPTDPTRYRVRAYSLRSWRLLPRPVVDPRERDEAMRGLPQTRATSADGRWAYTLYDGAGGTPFLHALDTMRRQARCIDLPLLAGRQDLGQLRLRPTGAGLAVTDAARTTVALVDTQTWRAGPPAVHHGTGHWLLARIAALSAILAATALSAIAWARRQNHASEGRGAGELGPTIAATEERAWHGTNAMRPGTTNGASRSRSFPQKGSRSTSRAG